MSNDIVFAIGLCLGSLCILSVLYNYLFKGLFALTATSILFVGFLLCGMSVWTLFKVKVGPDGGFEGEFQTAVGEASAKTNADFEEIKKALGTIAETVQALAKGNPVVQAEIKDIRNANAPTEEFKNNSNSTILIFSKDKQYKNANILLEELLSRGFKASVLKSDLTEADQKIADNTALIAWEAGTEAAVGALKSAISKALPGETVEVRKESQDLNRGDIQVLMF